MFSKTLTVLACGLLVIVAGPVSAEDLRPDTPTAVKGARVIGVDEARALLDGKAAAFFDTRSPVNYGKSHIPGATLISYKEKSEFRADFDATQDSFEFARLPADRSAAIIIYSDGPKGWKSYKATVLAVKAGYRNVAWMRDGFVVWVAKNQPVER